MLALFMLHVSLKERHLRLVATCQEGRRIDIKSFYVKAWFCCHNIMSNTKRGKFPKRRHSTMCETSRQRNGETKANVLFITLCVTYLL